MEINNVVAVICCSDLKPEEIITRVFETETLPNGVTFKENLTYYPWHVETKYYSTYVNLLPLKTKDLFCQEFADSVEAVLVHFDSTKGDTFEDVKSWLPFIKEYSPEVQLLICDTCHEKKSVPSGLNKLDIINWCLQNHFELVELNPEYTEDEDDDFKETRGYKRIVQALHAHIWPKLKLREPPVYQPSQDILDSIKQDNTKHCASASDSAETDTKEPVSKEDSTKRNLHRESQADQFGCIIEGDRWLYNALNEEDPSGKSFEEMFDYFLQMKEKAKTLEGEERKLYAENVAIQFWNAIGGDEDEIAGLSSDEN